MSGRLSIDTAILREAGTHLRAVAQEFVDADARSDAVADAVGHGGLAERLRDFSRGWDDRRGKLVEGISTLAEACTGIGEGFEDLDTQLGAALRGES